MPATGRVYRLGKDQTFDFAHADGAGVINANTRNTEETQETAAEARVTTRGSDEDEFVPVWASRSFTCNALWHTCRLHGTGLLTVGYKAGTTGRTATGVFFVASISNPHEMDGEVVETITFRKHPG
jgi:hypothetical protein